MKDVITQALFEGRFHEWWCLKKERRCPPPKTSQIAKCASLTTNRALVIARSVLLVDQQVM